jgi:hypothetical protein
MHVGGTNVNTCCLVRDRIFRDFIDEVDPRQQVSHAECKPEKTTIIDFNHRVINYGYLPRTKFSFLEPVDKVSGTSANA